MNPTTWGASGPPVPDLCGCEAPGRDRKDTGTKLASRQKAGSEGGVLALTLSLVSGSSALGAESSGQVASLAQGAALQLSMGAAHVCPLIPKGPSHKAVQ